MMRRISLTIVSWWSLQAFNMISDNDSDTHHDDNNLDNVLIRAELLLDDESRRLIGMKDGLWGWLMMNDLFVYSQ